MTTTLNDNNFEYEVFGSGMPVLVDFWAEWCSPCKLLNSIIIELEDEYKDRLKVCKANIEDNKNIISKYGISNLPTIFFVNESGIIDKSVGVQKKKIMKEKIESIIGIATK